MPLCGQLLHGDILLTRNREAADVSARLQSDVIAKVTGGDFSHALICSVPPTFVEALGNGVGNFSIQNGFAHAMRNVRVLRYPDAEIAKMAGNEAARVLGKGYSVADASHRYAPKMSTPPHQMKLIFCSALVAAAFANAGAPEFMALDTWKTTPAIIQKLACLHDVTDTVFREALAPQNIEYMSALDGDRFETPSSLQTSY